MFPKYSVLMSVYKKEKPEWLTISIESILQQIVKPDEIVIVQDGPLTESLEKIIKKYKEEYKELFHVIKLEKNMGLGPALNKGIENCRNTYIMRMDSDDYCLKERSRFLLEVAEKHPEYGVIGSYEAEFEDDINNIVAIHKVPEKKDEIYSFMKRRCALLHPTVLYKKEIVKQCGGYKNAPLYEDYDLFLRIVIENNIPCYNVQIPLYHIRINDGFFRRRGGVLYMKRMIAFKIKQYRKGYMNFMDLVTSAGAHFIVCLLPNSLRRMVYIRLLRK